MKKVLIIALALIVSTPFISEASLSNVDVASLSCMNDTRQITVYMIKQIGSGTAKTKTQKKAIYDDNANTIYVDGDTYRVSKNSYYGKNDSRGSYEYVAGGIYYFNL